MPDLECTLGHDARKKNSGEEDYAEESRYRQAIHRGEEIHARQEAHRQYRCAQYHGAQGRQEGGAGAEHLA
jgi:hypothetical protein